MMMPWFLTLELKVYKPPLWALTEKQSLLSLWFPSELCVHLACDWAFLYQVCNLASSLHKLSTVKYYKQWSAKSELLEVCLKSAQVAKQGGIQVGQCGLRIPKITKRKGLLSAEEFPTLGARHWLSVWCCHAATLARLSDCSPGRDPAWGRTMGKTAQPTRWNGAVCVHTIDICSLETWNKVACLK